LPGVQLSKTGLRQADSLIERIGASTFDQIRVSPLERCAHTISPWLNSPFSKGLSSYLIDENLNEIDYGHWSGRKLSVLYKDPMWKLVQEQPSKVTFPGGEKLSAAQRRVKQSVLQAHSKKKSGAYLFVSHGDIIKSVVASLIGLPLNSFQNLIINPASLTVIDFDGAHGRLLAYSDTTNSIVPLLSEKEKRRALLGGGSGGYCGGKK
jgi:broad specificity phosphatase PhoE